MCQTAMLDWESAAALQIALQDWNSSGLDFSLLVNSSVMFQTYASNQPPVEKK